MTIRPATLADLTTLRLFWGALCDEQAQPYPTRTPADMVRWTELTAMRLERQGAGDPTVFIRLATGEAGEPLGFLSAWLEERTIGAPYHFWLVDHLYVVPAARGTQLGTALLAEAMGYAIASGITVVECIALAGDSQWLDRGMTPTLVRYMVDVRQYARLQQGRVEARGVVEGEPVGGELDDPLDVESLNGHDVMGDH